jgi:hypothetical protein
MAYKTRESVRASIFDSYFSEENRQAELDRLKKEQDARDQERQAADQQRQEAARQQAAQQQAAQQNANFSNVQDHTDTVAPQKSYVQQRLDDLRPIDQWSQNMSDTLAPSLQGWGQGLAGGAAILSADIHNIESGGTLQKILGSLLPGQNLAEIADPTGQARAQLGRALVVSGQQNRQKAVDTARRTKPVFGNETLSVGAADLAGSPTSVASIFGGPIGATLGGADQLLQQYGQNRVSGADPTGSAIEAIPQAALEFGGEYIKAGEFATHLPGVKHVLGKAADDTVKGSLERFIRRMGRTAVGEGSEEMLTTAAQAAADKAIVEAAPDSEAGKAANANLPRTMAEFGQQVIRSGVAGAMGAGTVGGPMHAMQGTAENAQRFHDLLDEASKSKAQRDALKAADKGRDNSITPEVPDRLHQIEAELATHRATAKTIQDKIDAQRAAFEAAGQTVTPRPNATLALAQKKISDLQAERAKLTGEDVIAQPAAQPTEAVAPVAPVKKTRKPAKKTVDKMQEFAGRNQVNDGENTPTTTDDIYARLLKNVGSKTTGVVHGLISKGNLKVVDSQEQIPDDAAQIPGTAGYYDGKKTYVVANQLDSKNPVGALLDVAAHEVHHAAQASGAVTMHSFVGDESANKLVKNIEYLANEGDTTAGHVIEAATKAEKENPGSYRDEVLGYAITAQRAARNKNTLFGRAVGNLVSAVRHKTGVDATFDDVAYLSDKLLQKAAVSDKSFEAKGIDPNSVVTRHMIIPTLNASKTTWRSVDGTRKYEISDATSHINNVGPIKDGQSVQLGDLLNHPDLYEELKTGQRLAERAHPLADTPVEFKRLPSGPGSAHFDPTGGPNKSGAIVIDDRIVHNNPNYAAYNGPLHRVLMHEVQHLVQKRGNADWGTSVDYIMHVNFPESWKFDKEADALNKDIVSQGKRLAVLQKSGASQDEINESYSEYTDKINDYNHKLDKFNADQLKAKKMYEQDLGEEEARRAQHGIDRPQDEIDMYTGANNEQNMLQRGLNNGEGKPYIAPARVHRAINLQNLQDIVDETEKERNRSWDFIVKWVGNDNVYLGRELNMIREAAEGYRTSILHRAEILGSRLHTAINKAADSTGKTREEVINAISSKLDAIDGKLDLNMRRSMVRSLDRQFPGVGKALDDVRMFKLQLSKEVIALRLKDIKDNPLSKKEAKIYRAIMKNEETWNTRAYLAMINSNNIGEDYAHNLLRTYNKNPDSESGKVVQRAIEFLTNNDLVIPPKENLADLPYEDVKRIYETWIGKAPKGKRGEAKAQMVTKLQAMPTKTKQEIFDKAYSTAKSLLGLTSQPTAIATYYRGAKQNRTIVEGRKSVPGPLRELMGEITDPVVREMLSLSRMAGFIGKTHVLTDIYEQGKGKWWTDEEGKNTPMRVSGEEFGPLDGKYVTRRLYDVMATSVQLEQGVTAMVEDVVRNPEKVGAMVLRGGGKFFSTISSAYKTSVLAYNPFAMVRNWMGSFMMAAQNGLYLHPQDIAVGQIETAKSLLAIATKKQGDASMAKTVEYQIAGIFDTATMGEIKSGMWDDMLKEISELDPTDKTTGQKIRAMYKSTISGRSSKLYKVNDAARSMYAGMDMWVKASTYENRKRFLLNYHKAEGTGKTEKEIIRQAGYETNLVNITYKNASNIVKATERFASPIAMFLTYYSEVYRANFASYALAARDLELAHKAKTTEGRTMATSIASQRFAGTLAMSMGLNALILGVLGNVPDEEKRKRFLDAAWEKYDLLINVGLTKDGNEVMLGFSQIDPSGPLNEAIRTFLMEDDKEKAMGIIAKGFFTQNRMAIASMNLLRDIAVHAVGAEGTEADHPRKRTTQLQQNWPEFYAGLANHLSAGDVGENLAEVIDAMIPGIARPLYRMHSPDKLAEETRNGGGAIEKTIRGLGGNMYVRKPDLDMGFKIRDYTKGVTAIKRKVLDYIERTPNLTVDEAISKMTDAEAEEYKMYGDLDNSYQGYLAYHPSTDRIDAMLKDNRLFADTKRNLQFGGFDSQVINQDVIDKWYDKQSKGLTGDDLANLDRVHEVLSEAYGKLKDNAN